MRQQRNAILAALLAMVTTLAGIAPAGADHGPVHGINPADMDLSIDPRADFYRFANGGWLDRTEIPSNRGSYGTFREVRDRAVAQQLDLLGRLAASGEVQPTSDEGKAVALFAQGTDLATRNAQGLVPVRPILDQIDAIDDLAEYHHFLQGAGFSNLGALFFVYGAPSLTDSSINAAYLSGPFLGLPNRDYYLEDDPANEAVRAAYLETGAKLLGFLGYDPARSQASVQAVYDLERTLAEQTLTREEQQDISLFNNPTPLADLAAQYPLMDWPRYLQTLGLDGTQILNVDEAKYLKALDGIVRQTPLEALKDHLRLEVFWTWANNLSEEIEATAFAFTGTVLNGQQQPPPLEERVLNQVNAGLGQAVGKLYVAEYFPPEAKVEIEALVDELIGAFRHRLETNAWMTPQTKVVALDKLAKMGVKVGYPDHWRSYEAVAIGPSYAETALSAFNAEYRRTLAQVGQPVDEREWRTTPQTVNAFYSSQRNEIVFPAGILQPPFFDYQADPAANYGAIGMVIGHEITHGLDLQGSQFDADGNLVNWWTEEDAARFAELNERVAQQYFAIEVLPGVFVDGQITVTENVTDLGGVQVAYDALRNHLAEEGRPLPPPPGLRADVPPIIAPHHQEQRFFVAAATFWRTEYRDQSLTTLVKTDPHSPGMVRAVQPLRNTDAFHEAFDVQPGDPMYLPPEERVVIW